MAYISGRAPARASYIDLFTPKLVTTLREGYGLSAFRADAIAGLTVAIVALPLAMAIAIASGTTPDRGLFTAIVAGFLISALGGSRFQIGGPTAAFIVIVYGVIERHGYDGLALATLMAGLMLIAIGLLRIGSYIKYIPHPVTTGFTAGIAATIAVGQVKDLLGLAVEKMPGEFLGKVEALSGAIGTISPATVAISGLTLGTILLLRRYRPKWPGLLIAVALGSIVALAGGLEVATIQSEFGGVPRTLPEPHLPAFDLAKAYAVLPDAVTIALLAGIESLLSAVVADGMTGRRHRSNCELVAQGIANLGSVLFGGLCATGAIARTATNIRSGAHGPVAGMLHAVFLLVFMGVAAPLAGYFPLASLGAVLIIVAWNMSDAPGFLHLLKSGSNSERVVLVVTFALTVLIDLTVAIQVGVVLAAVLFMHRMAETVAIETHQPLITEDRPDSDEPRPPYRPEIAGDQDLVVYRIEGPFFFGAANKVVDVLERIGRRPKAFVLDFSAVPIMDSTGAHALGGFVRKARHHGATVYCVGVRPQPRHEMKAYGLKPPDVVFAASVPAAVQAARGETALRPGPSAQPA